MSALRRIPWNFYGTWAIVLSALMAVTTASILFYGYPVFFPVIVKEFAWPATVAATAASLGSLQGGFEGPIIGWVLDKYGPRVVILIFGVMAGAGLIAMITINDLLQYYIIYGVIVTIGTNAAMYVPNYKLLSNWWVRRRGMAMGAFVLPTGLGATVAPMLAAWGIANYGWRPSIAVMGIIVIAVLVPCGVLTRPHPPEYYGLLPDGDDPKKITAATVEEKKAAQAALAQETMKKEVDLTLKEAAKTNAFWIFAIGNTFLSFGTKGVIPFLPALFMSRGFDMTTAAFFAGITLTFSYAGRFAVLFFADALTPKWMWVLQSFLLAAGSFSAALATPDTIHYAWGYSLLYGVGFGMMVPLTPTFRGWLFGRTAFGTIGGVFATIAMAGSITSPIVSGYAMDATGTYFPAYLAMAGAAFVSGAVFIFVKRPKPKEIPLTAASQA